MFNKKINLGKIEPTRFVKGNNLILYNRFTQKKIFTTIEDEKNLDINKIDELASGDFTVTLPSIKKYRVEVTLDCNCACDYCLVYKNDIPQIGNSMSLRTAKEITDRFNREVTDGSIMLIGGEPLLNLDIVKFFIDNINGRINLFTNGTLINEEISKIVSAANVTTYISLDGRKNENLHRKFSNGSQIFKATMKGYHLLKEVGAKTAINCLVTNDNVQRLEEIVHFFHETFEEKSFGLSIPHHTKEGFNVDIKEYTSQMTRLADYALKEKIYIDQIAKVLNSFLKEEFRLYSCKIVGEQRTFYPDGVETLCTKMDTIKDRFNLSIESLTKSLPLYKEACEPCSAVSICGGGCFWDGLHDNLGVDSRNCYFNKVMLEHLLFRMFEDTSKNQIKNSEDLLRIYEKSITK